MKLDEAQNEPTDFLAVTVGAAPGSRSGRPNRSAFCSKPRSPNGVTRQNNARMTHTADAQGSSLQPRPAPDLPLDASRCSVRTERLER
jgi:hypothetical protein